MDNKIKEIDLSQFDNLVSLGSQRIYVENTPYGHEWSFTAPAHIMEPDNELLRHTMEALKDPKNCLVLFDVMPEIFAPVNEIATRVSDLKFVLRRFDDDEIVWDNENFNRLFAQPNPLMDFKKHLWTSVVYEIVCGGSFEYINRPALRSSGFESVKTLSNIPANEIYIEEKEDNDPYTATEIKDYIKRIYVKRKSGTDRDFDINNVMMVLNPDLSCSNKIKNFKTKLAGASAAIRNLIPVYQARNQIYVKRGALGFIVGKKKDGDGGTKALTPKEKEDLQRDYNSTYGFHSNKNMFAVSANEVDFVKTSASIQELQPFDETLHDALAIYTVLRVPKHLCPNPKNSTFNNANTDLKSFYEDVIIPMGLLRAQVYTNGLNIEGHYVDVLTSDIGILQENKKEKAETDAKNGDVQEKRFKNGVGTLNEWIVANGNEKSTDPLYDKRTGEMSEEELQRVKNFINLQSNNQQQNGTTPQNS